MKFLLITNNDFDGVGQRTISLNNELKSLGYECKTLVFYKSLKLSRMTEAHIWLLLARWPSRVG